MEKCLNGIKIEASCDDSEEAGKKSSSDITTPRILDCGGNDGEDGEKSAKPAEKDVEPPSQTTPPGDKVEEPEAPTQMPTGDLPDVMVTDVDRKLMGVCRDCIHQNDGTHLDGGVEDDAAWQARWRKLVALPAANVTMRQEDQSDDGLHAR